MEKKFFLAIALLAYCQFAQSEFKCMCSDGPPVSEFDKYYYPCNGDCNIACQNAGRGSGSGKGPNFCNWSWW